MRKTPDTSEILASLNEYVERQKDILEETNEELLKQGQEKFDELIAEKQDSFRKSLQEPNVRVKRNRTQIRHRLQAAFRQGVRILRRLRRKKKPSNVYSILESENDQEKR